MHGVVNKNNGGTMGKHVRYCLGIDLGIGSIGSAVLRLYPDNTRAGILDAGVRIFDVPAGAAERRQHRQERKTIAQRHKRLRTLTTLLQQHDLLPTKPEDLQELIRRSPYRLRAHGMHHAFSSAFELGRCLLHMAKFRGAGFLNQMEDAAESDELNSNAKKETQKTANFYRVLEEYLQKHSLTLSEFFRERLAKQQPIRRRKRFIEETLVNYAVPRFLVKADFSALWGRQASHFSFLNAALKKEIEQCLFAENPHAPYAVGRCSMLPESGELRLPRMHKLAEQRRIYEQVNNIRVQTRDAVLPLTRNMRDTLVTVLMGGEGLNKTKIKKYLQPFFDEPIKSINIDEKSIGIKGFSHAMAFANITSWQKMTEEEQGKLIDFIAEPRIHPENPESRLWPEDVFLQKLTEQLGLEGVQAKSTVARLVQMLPKDRSSLGLTATKLILEKLIQGDEQYDEQGAVCWRPLSQREAADACNFLAEEEEHRKNAGSQSCLPYYGCVLRHDVSPIHPWHLGRAAAEEKQYGRVPNPVVHVALNQLRKVVNEIIELYGKPQAIHVELARDFGKSKAQREAIEKEQRQRERDLAKIDEELKKIGMTSSRKNRTKFQLWKEQNCKDIYTGQNIAVSEIAVCDIDHIIPQACGGTNTYNNLALTANEVNKAKGDSFASAFVQSFKPDYWPDLLAHVSDKNYPKGKAWRFQSDAQMRFTAEGDDEQCDRRMTDTSYMAKLAARYLGCICENIVPVRGGMTAALRHLWGLDGLEYELMGLPIYKERIDASTGEVCMTSGGYPERNPEWKAKPRIDHRHHALDAVTIACTTKAMVQKIAKAEKLGIRNHDFPTPFGGTEFRQRVLDALLQVRVSVKPEHDKAGQLHDATKYRVLLPHAKEQGKFIIAYQRPFNKIESKAGVGKIIFPITTLPMENTDILAHYQRARFLVQAIEQQYGAAELELEKLQAQAYGEGKKIRAITEKELVQCALRLARRQDKRVGHKYTSVVVKTLVGVREKLQCGFEPQNNFCVDFYADSKGKVDWEVHTLFAVNQKNFIPEWKKQGGQLIWSLWKGDIVEIDVSESAALKWKMPAPAGKILFVVQKFSPGSMFLNLLYDARPLDATQGIPRWSTKTGLTNLTEGQARKVDLTPFGKIYRKHRKLWHGHAPLCK